MIDHLLVANSPLMLILCATVIVYVCVQSILFMKRAWNRGQEIGMEDKVMKSTILSSALFSIIPSIPILIILLMLMPV
ncbi:MAG: DUF5058 family protein [Tissierellia bacterium]|nr:DUF5058 family protein [Tissierellia bacterium]